MKMLASLASFAPFGASMVPFGHVRSSCGGRQMPPLAASFGAIVEQDLLIAGLYLTIHSTGPANDQCQLTRMQ